MSKSEHLSLLVSVVGLSGCGAEVYKGPGKSSLCFNLIHPTEYLKEHPSKLSLQQFQSKVIDKQHYVYWGTKTEYYYKLPKSKKATGERILVTVNFEIFEQTEFIEDITQKAFPAKHEYAERAMKLPHSSNRLSFKTVPLVLTPEVYGASVSPNTKGMKNGYIFTIDVSKGCPTFHHQLALLKRMVRPSKKLFVIAATKYDQVDPTSFEEVKIAAKAFNVEVIPTSIEMEDGRWVTEVFKYLAIKLFNLQSEDAYGVAGDSYLRYATEPPPTHAPMKVPMPKSKSVEEPPRTPPIPPRNYGNMPAQTPPDKDHGYGNFIQKQIDKSNLDRTLSTSEPDVAIPVLHTTEIPPSILARKPQTMDRKTKPRSMSVHAEASRNPTPMESLSASYTAPPLPPKPKSSYPPLSPREDPTLKSPSPIPIPQKSPIPIPQKSPIPTPPITVSQKSPISKPSMGAQAMAARPLPKLPFVFDDDSTDHYNMRCDYEKIDYTKMRHARDMIGGGSYTKTTQAHDMLKGSAQRPKVKPKQSNPASTAVPARNIPRKKESTGNSQIEPTGNSQLEPTGNSQSKPKPPPVAKKPTVKPRKVSANVNSAAKTEQRTPLPTEISYGDAQSLEYEDTVVVKNFDDDTGYVNEGADKTKPTTSSSQPRYPPRCIPRKYYFLKGRRALPES